MAEYRDGSDYDGVAAIEAERHQEDRLRGGCTCGFCAWSVERVVLMAVRKVVPLVRAEKTAEVSVGISADDSGLGLAFQRVFEKCQGCEAGEQRG